MTGQIIAGNGWPGDALEPVPACPACAERAPAKIVFDDVEDVLGGVPGTWRMRECPRCSSLFLDPRPAGSGLALAYATYYTHEAPVVRAPERPASGLASMVEGYLDRRFARPDGRGNRWGYAVFRLLPPLRQQLDYFLRHLPSRHGLLLDVGSGNGEFLRRATRAGWDAYGVEPDATAANVSRTAGCDVVTSSFEAYRTSRSFDAMTLSHVIEHVADPLSALRHAHGMLAPDGMLWIATPNAKAPGRRWYGRDWRGLEVPRHTIVFTAKALCTVLHEAGFVDIRFLRRGRGARYILDQSKLTARRRGVSRIGLPSILIDLIASIWATGAEELVITARKPR
ncbi:class I SAM-dependent methyltransferase [Luteibacter aegosomatissinici]|uniref:class I SAM-dependent methyltransferase n=1 Tax=Luteibacter aegosomatissinici TaxID=2911539 RepID=UPI001FFA912F|nr:class I SAM-dependent methyltransferase [Luteibacter aegosomatissinici]UPG95680.1 class I SAM-dependent methyltransferase [Luteibacter aegosomatissinici]